MAPACRMISVTSEFVLCCVQLQEWNYFNNEHHTHVFINLCFCGEIQIVAAKWTAEGCHWRHGAIDDKSPSKFNDLSMFCVETFVPVLLFLQSNW